MHHSAAMRRASVQRTSHNPAPNLPSPLLGLIPEAHTDGGSGDDTHGKQLPISGQGSMWANMGQWMGEMSHSKHSQRSGVVGGGGVDCMSITLPSQDVTPPPIIPQASRQVKAQQTTNLDGHRARGVAHPADPAHGNIARFQRVRRPSKWRTTQERRTTSPPCPQHTRTLR